MILPSITVYYPTIHRLFCRSAGPHLLAFKGTSVRGHQYATMVCNMEQ